MPVLVAAMILVLNAEGGREGRREGGREGREGGRGRKGREERVSE